MTEVTTVEIDRAEAHERVMVLSLSIQQCLAEKKELVDITLDALLATYLTVAQQTGRLHETPEVLLRTVESIAKALAPGVALPPRH